jgi:hypothetical protein
MSDSEGRYSVTVTDAGGTVTTTIMTWAQVRRYLPGGSEYDTAARVEARRIVSEATS